MNGPRSSRAQAFGDMPKAWTALDFRPPGGLTLELNGWAPLPIDSTRRRALKVRDEFPVLARCPRRDDPGAFHRRPAPVLARHRPGDRRHPVAALRGLP